MQEHVSGYMYLGTCSSVNGKMFPVSGAGTHASSAGGHVSQLNTGHVLFVRNMFLFPDTCTQTNIPAAHIPWSMAGIQGCSQDLQKRGSEIYSLGLSKGDAHTRGGSQGVVPQENFIQGRQTGAV